MQGQNPLNGLYINEDKNELICLKDDTISFRLYNYDAFNTYTLFLGSYKSNMSKIKLGKNIMGNETSIVNEGSTKDKSIQIHLSYIDGKPIKFAQVTLSNKLKNIGKVIKYSNEEGYLELGKEEINSLLGSCIKIKVETLGFITEQLIVLELGKSYNIISKAPNSIPFVVPDKKIIFNYKKYSESIEVISFSNRKIIFKRVGVCESCLDVVFKL